MIEINLEQIQVKACWDYGHEVTRGNYAERWPTSGKLSMLGAEKKPEVWARSKMAEMAFAIYVNLDPFIAVNLNVERGPDEYDVQIGNLLVDVKDSNTRKLIWSVRKGLHGLINRRFHAFVAARAREPMVELCGWVGRIEFISRCIQAKDGELLDGTPYMPHESLHPMADFPLPVV